MLEKHQHLIDKYLNENMTSEELVSFNNLISKNEQFANEVDLQKQLSNHFNDNYYYSLPPASDPLPPRGGEACPLLKSPLPCGGGLPERVAKSCPWGCCWLKGCGQFNP